MPRSTANLTKARGAVHGNYDEGATFTQAVMGLMAGTSNWPKLSASQKESLHMITHKTHRILTGNPDHQDHWDDIAGYAKIAAPSGKSVRKAKQKIRQARKTVRKAIKKFAKKVAARPSAGGVATKELEARKEKKRLAVAAARARARKVALKSAVRKPAAKRPAVKKPVAKKPMSKVVKFRGRTKPQNVTVLRQAAA